MQYKLQSDVALPKKTREVNFVTSLNITSGALLQLKLPMIWTRVPSELVRISEVLL
jgi:hypothetical protein